MIYKGSIVKGNGGGSGDAVWGSITGTLSDQTDLEAALAEKQDTLTAGSGIDITNGVISATGISYDNTTINKNSDNEIQTIGIKEARTDTAIRIWHGNQAEYDVGGEINPYDIWYDWQKISAESVDFQSNAPFSGVAYGNGKFVITGRQTTVPLYSSDGGLTWNETDLAGGDYPRVIFGDGTFVTAGRRSGAAYSDDGEHWTQVKMTNGGWGLAYGDGVFIASSLDNGTIFRSTDKGRKWRYAFVVPNGTLKAAAYGDGAFVVIDCADAGSQTCAYSDDGGNNWNLAQMPSNEVWSSVAYGNGRFIATSVTSVTGNTAAYSTDKGRTWTGFTLPYSAKWDSIIFDGNKFIVISGDNDIPFLYSYDGINWIQSPVNVKGVAAAYGNGKYIALGDREAFSGSHLGQEFSFSDVYTSTATPEVGDSLYDSPNVVSALTITSVDTTVNPNTITLSDSSVHTYNEYGNIYGHYSVGESYPNYLCFIDNKGTKIGDKTINDDWGQSLQGDITTDATFICAPYKLYHNIYVTSFSAPNLEKLGSLSYAFNGCTGLTSVYLSSLTSVCDCGLQNTFNGCTGLTSINNFEENIILIDKNGMDNCFRGCNLLQKVFDFKSLTSLGNYALSGTFANTQVSEIYFRALTSQSFNSFNTQFNTMLSGVTGCTVHFPSNLQSVIGSWSSVTSGFGGTNTTVLFDLPATE